MTYDALTNTVRLPTDGSQYVPWIGDRILCNDGTEYEIKNVEPRAFGDLGILDGPFFGNSVAGHDNSNSQNYNV